MGRKKVADMTPEELEAHRAYMREAKRKSRKTKPDKPRVRTEYQREYMRKRRKKLKDLNKWTEIE